MYSYSYMKLVRVTLFQRLTKVGKPKSNSSECIAPIAYYITNKKKLQVIKQKYQDFENCNIKCHQRSGERFRGSDTSKGESQFNFFLG